MIFSELMTGSVKGRCEYLEIKEWSPSWRLWSSSRCRISCPALAFDRRKRVRSLRASQSSSIVILDESHRAHETKTRSCFSTSLSLFFSRRSRVYANEMHNPRKSVYRRKKKERNREQLSAWFWASACPCVYCAECATSFGVGSKRRAPSVDRIPVEEGLME